MKYVEWDYPEAQAKGELNFLHCSNRKGSTQDLMLLSKARLWQQKFYSEPNAIEYGKILIAKGCIQNLTWSSTTDSKHKGFHSEYDAVKYNKDSKLQHDLMLGTKPWKS